MKFSNDVEKYKIGVTKMGQKKKLLLTVNVLFSTDGVTSSCLVAFSVYFTLSDQHVNWMTREKGLLNAFRYYNGRHITQIVSRVA